MMKLKEEWFGVLADGRLVPVLGWLAWESGKAGALVLVDGLPVVSFTLSEALQVLRFTDKRPYKTTQDRNENADVVKAIILCNFRPTDEAIYLAVPSLATRFITERYNELTGDTMHPSTMGRKLSAMGFEITRKNPSNLPAIVWDDALVAALVQEYQLATFWRQTAV